ncbi:MAG: hypothetical protein K2N05_12085 [Muribaculaceae bacterium]|nr:hypothetical protein [Muribaculaceae bacterium]
MKKIGIKFILSLAMFFGCISLFAQQTDENKNRLEMVQKIAQIQARANAGDAQAQYELGVMYRKGVIPGIFETPDNKEASRWYAKSAQGGCVDGMVSHAGMLYYGIGAYGKDLKAAKEWYSKAAKKGSTYAVYALGKSEQEGWDGNPNDEKAFQY